MKTQTESTPLSKVVNIKREELNPMQERLCGQVHECGESAEIVLGAQQRQALEGAERPFAALFVP